MPWVCLRPVSYTHLNTTVCPLAKKCGGCQLQNLSYPAQLHLKQATAIRLLGRFGHVEEILGTADPYHYRNKVQAAFGVNRQGQIISGVYQSASHRIVPVSDCLIEDKVADRIIVTIRKLLKSFKIRPYDEDTGRGTMRHVLVRRGRRSGEILVVLVTAHGCLLYTSAVWTLRTDTVRSPARPPDSAAAGRRVLRLAPARGAGTV